MKRRVNAEQLDELPFDAPAATAARRNLRTINHLMGNFRWFRHVIAQDFKKTDRLIELGAGMGELGFELLKDFDPPLPKGFHPLTPIPFPPTVCESGGVLTWEGTPFFESPAPVSILDYTGLDRIPCPPDWPPTWHWRRMDLLTLESFDSYSIILGNFILHHFKAEQLKELGKKLQAGPRLLIFNEPRRSRLHQTLAAYTRLIGFHPVFVNDAWTSIEAGFVGDELPTLLGLHHKDWSIHYDETALGSYRMIAKRR